MHSPLSSSDRAALWIRLAIRLSLTALGTLAAFSLAPRFLSLFAPFLLALLIAWLLHPPVHFLQSKFDLSRRTAAFILLFLCGAAVSATLYGLGYAAFVQIRSLIADWASIRQSLLDLLTSFSQTFSRFSAALPSPLAEMTDHIISASLNWFRSALPAALDASLDGAGALMTTLPSFAVSFIVFVMASYFITADYPRLRFFTASQFPPRTLEFGRSLRRIFRDAFGGYIRSQLLLSLGVFSILSISFLFIKQPYGLILALLLSLLDFIPIVGSGTVIVPWALLNLVTGSYRTAIELLVIWGFVVLFRRTAEPKILGDQTGLSPILSLVGIYLGMRAGGIFGMVIGPLALLVLINLCKLGTFDPTLRDLKLCAADLNALLSPARKNNP